MRGRHPSVRPLEEQAQMEPVQPQAAQARRRGPAEVSARVALSGPVLVVLAAAALEVRPVLRLARAALAERVVRVAVALVVLAAAVPAEPSARVIAGTQGAERYGMTIGPGSRGAARHPHVIAADDSRC
jgi:hypothetical protein